MTELLIIIAVCGSVSALIAVGVRLERGRAALMHAKKFDQILSERDKIEKEARETNDKIHSGNFDHSDIGQMLSSYKKH